MIIDGYHLSVKTEGTEELLEKKILDVLSKYNVDMIFLADRVLQREHEFLVEVISDIANGKIKLG